MKCTLQQLLAWSMVLCVLMSVLAGCTGSGEGQTTTVPIQGQTEAPTDPTEAPTDPTEAPTDPTEAPTDAPTDPPATEPPATDPPATEPPAPANDIGKEISKDEYSITVLEVQKTDNQYTVTFTLTYSGEGEHSLSIKERVFLVNSERRSLAADNAYDTDGNSLLGSSIQKGQTITIKAVFTLSDGYEPSAFRYVYDIMGFRRLQAEL